MTGMCKCGHPGSSHSFANGMCYHTNEPTKDKHRRDCPCNAFRQVVMLTEKELQELINKTVRSYLEPPL